MAVQRSAGVPGSPAFHIPLQFGKNREKRFAIDLLVESAHPLPLIAKSGISVTSPVFCMVVLTLFTRSRTSFRTVRILQVRSQ